jgi:hypothetical protein
MIDHKLPKPPNSDMPSSAWLPPQRTGKRRMLWEIGGSMQCSVLGTCLGEDDLLGAIRKCGLSLQGQVTSYEIHAHCVKMATAANAVSKALHKLLDKRYEGAVRLISRADTDEQVLAAWEKLRGSGQTGAAYWAIISHTHVTPEAMKQVFGEVHMLSHLHGRGVREMATQIAEMQRRAAETEARLRRADAARNEALAERDAARAELQTRAAGMGSTDPADALGQVARVASARKEAPGKRDRVLAAARARARQAESDSERLRAAVQALQREQRREQPAPLACSCCKQDTRPCRLDGRRILYLGGRKSVLPHLKSAAEAREAILLVHDGGVEDSAHRIEELVCGCDAVVCPIDCVSHGACKLAKVLCRRFNKPFLPIPTASRSGFERALDQLATGSARADAFEGASGT